MANVTAKELNSYYDRIAPMIKKIMESNDSDTNKDLMMYIIENILRCIANDLSFEASYKANGERRKFDIQLINNEIEDEEEEEEGELSEVGDTIGVDMKVNSNAEDDDYDADDDKLSDEELGIMSIADQIKIDDLCERCHNPDLFGEGCDFKCDKCPDMEEDDDGCPYDCDECPCDEEPEFHKPMTYREIIDKMKRGEFTIDDKFEIVADGLIELLDRTLAIEAFCSQVCDTIAADKKLSKTFDKCAKAKNKKYKAIKAVKKATE